MMLRIGVVQDHISVGVRYAGIKLRNHIGTLILNGSIGSVELIGGDTIGHTAQSKRLNDIGFPLTVIIISLLQSSKAKALQIIITHLWSDHS